MNFFKRLEGHHIVVRKGGVYTQCDLYERGGFLYLKKGGFIRVLKNQGTSVPTLLWDEMTVPVVEATLRETRGFGWLLAPVPFYPERGE